MYGNANRTAWLCWLLSAAYAALAVADASVFFAVMTFAAVWAAKLNWQRAAAQEKDHAEPD